MLRFEVSFDAEGVCGAEKARLAREVRRKVIRDSMACLEYFHVEDLRSATLHLQSLLRRQRVG